MKNVYFIITLTPNELLKQPNTNDEEGGEKRVERFHYFIESTGLAQEFIQFFPIR